VSAASRDLVERFYNVVWNKADEAEARRISRRGFSVSRFPRPRVVRACGFIAYLRSVHAALENFTCTIEELIATQDRAAARMSFSGTHRAKFFGFEATGREICWNGAAFFRIGGATIIELWVLGDIEAVRRQLEPERRAAAFSVRPA